MAMRAGHTRELGQTSAGVGHVQPLRFYVKSHKGVSLPPVLQRSPLQSTSSHFSVTSHSDYTRKPQTRPLTNTPHPKAPPHWNTHFLNELAQRLRNCGTVHLLPQPISEVQDNYRGQSAKRGPLLDHYSTLLTLYGQLVPDQDPTGTVDRSLSTAHADYRRYSSSEIVPLSGVEAPPSHLSVTKSSAHSHLPSHKAPPTMSCFPRLPRPAMPLPYTGKHSQYMESFHIHTPRFGASPAALTDWRAARNGSGDGGAKRGLRDILEVPKMYQTENQAYGGNRTVLV
ncbi:hypothetical protein UPYG_G00110150 [Umbra pygmaea]|uniref:Uncharacterized protein n=1 Tax=Umbra pygmaea TaxID=75934 RepID=A0ABD0X6E5_UMBPY